MSLTVLLHVREGIVMASDRRLLIEGAAGDDAKAQPPVIGASDSCRKLFLAAGAVGIASFGESSIRDEPISGYLDIFIREQVDPSSDTAETIARKLSTWCRAMPNCPDLRFFVAGHVTEKGRAQQHIYRVHPMEDRVERTAKPGSLGATWGGESDILARLTQHVVVVDENGSLTQRLGHFPISWPSLTLQDAIDFAVFAIRTTARAMRFQARPQRVGEKVDVLVLRPEGAEWVRRSPLSADPDRDNPTP